MATATKQFSFNVDLETWAFTGGNAATTGSRDTTEDSTNDTNAGTGAMQARTAGKNKASSNYWEWSGTWEGLGVPAGATVTAVNCDYDWKCSEYATGSSDSTGPMELRNSAGTLRNTFSTALGFSATGSWASRAGSNQTGLTDASNTSIKLRLNSITSTGNSTSAAVTLRQDWVVVTITYTVGATVAAATQNIPVAAQATTAVLTGAVVGANAVTVAVTVQPASVQTSGGIIITISQPALAAASVVAATARGGALGVVSATTAAFATFAPTVVFATIVRPSVQTLSVVVKSLAKKKIYGRVDATLIISASTGISGILRRDRRRRRQPNCAIGIR